MSDILLVQPSYAVKGKVKDTQKYLPLALLKLGSLYRAQGHTVSLILGNARNQQLPLHADLVCITTVFSWWWHHYCEAIEQFRELYPSSQILIGGPFASAFPALFTEKYPFVRVHQGLVPEAERCIPAFDLLPSRTGTQIISFSHGCKRRCSFCISSITPYEELSFDEVRERIVKNRLILNDMNLMLHSQVRTILAGLAHLKVNDRPVSSVELQGGIDARVIAREPDLVPLMKKARFANIRIAWDGSLDMLQDVERTTRLLKQHWDVRNIRCYVLTNHDVPFDETCEKLLCLSRLQVGAIASRFRPLDLLHDGYVSQCHRNGQGADEYYIHPGWTDQQVRVAGSLAADTGRQSRLGLANLDDVRRFNARPTVAETLARVA